MVDDEGELEELGFEESDFEELDFEEAGVAFGGDVLPVVEALDFAESDFTESESVEGPPLLAIAEDFPGLLSWVSDPAGAGSSEFFAGTFPLFAGIFLAAIFLAGTSLAAIFPFVDAAETAMVCSFN